VQLKAATSVAAELLGRNGLGVLAPGKLADIVAMPGDAIADIGITARFDFVMKDGIVHRGSARKSDTAVRAASKKRGSSDV
jgi:imidazolonepropionase-like amidohydrolase